MTRAGHYPTSRGVTFSRSVAYVSQPGTRLDD
jgi:hypothetical protein